jgi:hypothetical protein
MGCSWRIGKGGNPACGLGFSTQNAWPPVAKTRFTQSRPWTRTNTTSPGANLSDGWRGV